MTVTSMTIGKGDMADKTGNSYTAGSTTDGVEIPMATLLSSSSSSTVPNLSFEFWYYLS